MELLKGCLTRVLIPDAAELVRPRSAAERLTQRMVLGLATATFRVTRGGAWPNLRLAHHVPFDLKTRELGLDQPYGAETMIGLRRLNNIQSCVVDVIKRNIPGDLVETGVWRGGASIFMRGILEAYGDTSRAVWLADSFEGLPKPDPAKYPADTGDKHWENQRLAVSEDEVRANFKRYGLLDSRVRFLHGWFHETLPNAAVERIAVLRLDGDMYESTIVALDALYHKVSPGGYVIVDDYGAVAGCNKAVDDFRSRHKIHAQLTMIEGAGAYWRVEESR